MPYVAVGELQTPLGAVLVVLGDLTLLAQLVDVTHFVAADARTETRPSSAMLRASLMSSRRRSSVSSGMGRRRILPSFCGLRPMSESLMPRSIFFKELGSKGVTVSKRGRGRRRSRRPQGHARPVDLDLDPVEQRRVGAARVDGREVAPHRIDCSLHPPLGRRQTIHVGHLQPPPPFPFKVMCAPHQRAHALSLHTAQVALFKYIENDYGEVLAAAQRGRRVVHYGEVVEEVHVSQAFQADRVGLARVLVVDAIYPVLRHEQGIGVYLEGPARLPFCHVKKGLPVPEAKMTTLPFSRCRMARRRM